MKFRKILTGLLALSIAAASFCVVVFAADPSYKVSEAYKDTLYYNNLKALELTGDGATDTIAVALSQLGYHEGNNDAEKDGLNGSGSKNFVEYNVLFGKLDNGEGNGTSYGYAWCAAFVNWCLRQARVDDKLTGGMYVSCAAWRNWFIYEGEKYGASYHSRTDDYIPKKGDLIFYKSLTATHNRPTDHIGIVLKCEQGKVYTIEGNGDNRVALHEYALTDKYIVGYGSIAYKTADVPEVDYYRTEDHLPGFFVAGKGILSVYNGPNTSTGKVATLKAGAVYRILAVQGRFGYVELEDGSSGWTSIKRFTPMTTDPYYTVTLMHGEQSYEIRVAAGTDCTIPETALLSAALGEMADLVGWSTEDGMVLTAGQAFTPEADVTLHAAFEMPTEAESDTEPKPQATTDAPESGNTDEDESEYDLESTEKVQEGCGGVIGASAVIVILTAAAAMTVKKKKN